jgi:hypothetical protein
MDVLVDRRSEKQLRVVGSVDFKCLMQIAPFIL